MSNHGVMHPRPPPIVPEVIQAPTMSVEPKLKADCARCSKKLRKEEREKEGHHDLQREQHRPRLWAPPGLGHPLAVDASTVRPRRRASTTAKGPRVEDHAGSCTESPSEGAGAERSKGQRPAPSSELVRKFPRRRRHEDTEAELREHDFTGEWNCGDGTMTDCI